MEYIKSTQDVLQTLKSMPNLSSVARVLDVEKAINEDEFMGNSLRELFRSIRYNPQGSDEKRTIEQFIDTTIKRTEKGNFARVLKALRGAPLILTKKDGIDPPDVMLKEITMDLLTNEYGQISRVELITFNPKFKPTVLMNPLGSIGHEYLMATYQFPYTFWVVGTGDKLCSFCANTTTTKSDEAYKILLQSSRSRERRNYSMAVEKFRKDQTN